MKIVNLKLILFTFLFIAKFSIQAQDGTVKSFVKIKKGDAGLSGIDFTNMTIFGSTVTNIGDIDRDGVVDIAVKGYTKNKDGKIFILFLKKDGSVKSSIEISEGKGGLPLDFTTANLSGFGISIASIGDFDKDGVPDIAVGNPGYSDNFQGEIYIFLLNSNGTVKDFDIIGEGKSGFNGNLSSGNDFGCSLTNIGDLDKDGVIDLAIGAYGDSEFGKSKGAVWLLFLNTDRSVKTYKKLNSGTSALSSLKESDAFGYSITPLGDFDNDNNLDIAVSAPFSDEGGTNRGSIRIMYLNSDGSIKNIKKISQIDGNFNDSIPNGTLFGEKISFLGDIDGDSINDISVGATSYNKDIGAIWNIFLKKDGTCKSVQKITSNTGGFNVTLDVKDAFGLGLDLLGDLNGDGINDLVTAAILDDDGGTDIGALYILFLNGKPQFITPIASFTQSKDTIKLSECVNFNDNSTNNPTNWKWTFQGGNPSTSTLQNPSNICFSSVGKYIVNMIAFNSKGSDTSIKTIVVNDPAGLGLINNLSVQIIPNPFSYNTTIHTGKYLSNSSLHVYNTQGQLIKQLNNISGQEVILHRDNLNAGLYFLNIMQDNKTVTKFKLIVTD